MKECVKMCKWLKLIWEFLNKPLIIGIIVILLYFTLGQKEKVKCDFMVNPNVDYLKSKFNLSEGAITSFLQLYREPFRANLTFDTYREALAFKELTFSSQSNYSWYTPILQCDEDKIVIPLSINEAILNKLKRE